jgi:glycosyltransferase involved in cell wall biosynthesis
MIRITHLITDLDTGGAEVMLARLLEAEPAGRREHSVISLTTVGPVGQRIQGRGIPVFSLGAQPRRLNPVALWKLVRLLRRLRPDILHTWLYHADLAGLLAAPLSRTPKLVWNIRCAALEWRDYRASLAPLLKALALTSRRPVAIVCNSIAGQTAHERLGYAPRRWHIIPNGFDTEMLRPSETARPELHRRLGLPDATDVVGLLARYHPMKDHLTFFNAAARVARERPGVHFVAAGRNVANNAVLEDSVRALGASASVSLCDEQTDVARFLGGLDLYVSSSSYGEGFPNVVAEAMACGTVCVVTDVSESARIVGDTGTVVPPRDPEALAGAILHHLSLAPAQRAALSTAARARIMRQFSIDRIAAEYDNLYMGLMQAETKSKGERARME